MKRSAAAVLVLLAASAAWAKVNFNGEWAFNEGKSKLDQMGAAFIQSKMTVQQTDAEMAIAKTMQGFDGGTMVMEEKLTLDGKECRSEFWGSQRVSKAVWAESGDALLIVSTITFERDGQTSVLDITEEWRLSEDGKTLSVKHHSSSDWGERNITMVFDLVQPAQ